MLTSYQLESTIISRSNAITVTDMAIKAPKNAVVWVAGGRNYQNSPRIFYILDSYHERHGIRKIVTGAQHGTDLLAEEWAKSREIPYTGIPAKWAAEGKAAGPTRNERIASEEKPDVLIAFPGGPGTASAIQIAEQHGIPVFRIRDVSSVEKVAASE